MNVQRKDFLARTTRPSLPLYNARTKQDGNVATLTVHYKAKDKGPVNIVTPRPNP